MADAPSTSDEMETGTVVDRETGLVADVAVDPQTGTVVGTDRETGTTVAIDGRTGTATVVEPGTGTGQQLRTGVEEGLTTRAFPGERVGPDTGVGPSIRPTTGQGLTVRPDVGVGLRVTPDAGLKTGIVEATGTGVGVRDDIDVAPKQGTGLLQGLETGTATGLGVSEFTVPEFRVPGDAPAVGPMAGIDVPDGGRIRPEEPRGRPRQDDPEKRRGRPVRPRPDIPGPEAAKQEEATSSEGDPVEAEFVTYELNRVNFLTGETEEIPLDDTHEETLRVTRRGRSSTSGVDVDTGGVTVSSRGGRVSASDEPKLEPRWDLHFWGDED